MHLLKKIDIGLDMGFKLLKNESETQIFEEYLKFKWSLDAVEFG